MVETTNNPLNIRYNPRNQWVGQIGEYKGFCKFSSLYYGYRAAYVLLCNYIEAGYDTIEKIVKRWAPDEDGNNTSIYIGFITLATDMQRYKTVDKSDLVPIMRFMSKIESGILPDTAFLEDMIKNIEIELY